MPKFLSVYSMFDEPVIEFNENHMLIKAGKQKVKYFYAESSLIVSTEKDVVFKDPIVTFDLTKDQVTSIMKMGAVLQVPEIAIVGDGSKLSIQGINSKNNASESFSDELGDTSEVFKAIMKIENLKLVPDDYKVSVSKIGCNFDGKIYYSIVNEKHSEF